MSDCAVCDAETVRLRSALTTLAADLRDVQALLGDANARQVDAVRAERERLTALYEGKLTAALSAAKLTVMVLEGDGA